MIKLVNVSKSYGNNIVLDKINLSLEDNKIYGLIGRNGVGKTTLMKILSDQILSYQGEIFIDGSNIKNDKTFKENLVFISDGFISDMQQASKLKSLTSTIKILAPMFNQKRYDELMDIFMLNEKTRYNKLSYGNQGLYRSIIGLSTGAKIIFLDEPANGLDEINRDKFYKKIIEYQEQDQSLIMVSSHILSDIERVVTDIIFLKDSKVALNETVEFIEEKAYMITIDEDHLKFLENKNILSYKKVGKQLVVMVYDDFTSEELGRLNARVDRMNLQELFKAFNKEA
ncbi:ATP-binding cassette domain-containing protein [Anaerococcus provencensis]|uniref:ATP-binding cassette domain-containing protein n=1 Tax=Anaerococcus provencensis TaxID=938293 RepID=UPI0002E7B5C9|nr:ABC transporter ATP-binding protein [Anaerococcus provencensis]